MKKYQLCSQLLEVSIQYYARLDLDKFLSMSPAKIMKEHGASKVVDVARFRAKKRLAKATADMKGPENWVDKAAIRSTQTKLMALEIEFLKDAAAEIESVKPLVNSRPDPQSSMQILEKGLRKVILKMNRTRKNIELIGMLFASPEESLI